jgi:hypothetical protein
MGIKKDNLSSAVDKFADTDRRMGTWELWPKYEIWPRENGRSYIERVEPNEADLGPRVYLAKALERTNGTVSPGSPEEKVMQEAIKRDNARKESYPYQPLVRFPDLFLKFARLADAGGLDGAETKEGLDTDGNAAVALQWAHDHGVLGLTLLKKDGSRGASTLGGKEETVAAFAHEAWVANGCLRLYEAATAEDLDLDLIASYMPPRLRSFFPSTPARAREWALDSVAIETQRKVAGNAYPALYGEVGRFVRGWDFINLLGAMWLQMFWLLTASEAPRRCRNWECDKIIEYEQPGQPGGFTAKNDRSGGYRTRVDKGLCSKKCANRYYYLTKTKRRRQLRKS